jgi:peroxiredoxin family protein/TusA-related sulfurtransferase
MNPTLESSSNSIIDCRGLQCPAPILRLSEAARQYKGGSGALTVLATDVDFPVDLEAWCRTTKASLVRLEREQDGLIRAQIRLFGSAPTIPSAALRLPDVAADSGVVDLDGMSAVAAMRKLNELSLSSPGRRVTVECDAPGFEGRLAAWTSATDTALEAVRRSGNRVTAVLVFPPDPVVSGAPVKVRPIARPAPGPVPVISPPSAQAVIPVELDQAEGAMEAAVPRENRATLLVLHNDLEALLAALMVANASASQGMDVEVYFAFWGIHLLRGERPREHAPESNRGLIQTMMLWMVPKGPGRQKLGKLHMGGIGTRILLWLMRKRNILALDKLVEAAVNQGVKFRVCSMSMGLMGLSQRDIVDLPNVTFAGVTSFAETARRSATSLVF